MAGQPGRSGGARQGAPGVSYPNRTDLMQKQRGAPAAPAAAPGGAAGGAPPPPAVPLDAPTSRPGEHVMAGVGMGPGPGPQEAGLVPPIAGSFDPIAEQLMAILSVYPNDDLRNLVESIKAGDYSAGGAFGSRL